MIGKLFYLLDDCRTIARLIGKTDKWKQSTVYEFDYLYRNYGIDDRWGVMYDEEEFQSHAIPLEWLPSETDTSPTEPCYFVNKDYTIVSTKRNSHEIGYQKLILPAHHIEANSLWMGIDDAGLNKVCRYALVQEVKPNAIEFYMFASNKLCRLSLKEFLTTFPNFVH